MQAPGNQLKQFYQRELGILLDDATAFAQAHPLEAQALGLGKGTARDPQVEMLIQAFAFLAGRVQYEVAASKAVVANALLEDLYPHLAAPLPCMSVAQFHVKPDGADGARIERGRQVYGSVLDERGRTAVCRLRTTTSSVLTALTVTAAELLQPNTFPVHLRDETTLGALRVRVQRLGSEPIEAMQQRCLRFFIDPAQKHAYYLHELLAVHLIGISLAPAQAQFNTEQQARSQPQQLHWLGFGENEAALPARPHMHPGHRLLQEYFALPEKFLFFDTEALDFIGLEGGFDLYFHFDVPLLPERQISADALKLNCVPLVNLYQQRIDPLTLDHTQYEYRLSADSQGQQHSEIHSIQELNSIKADGSLRQLRPHFEMESSTALAATDYFYALRRQASQLGEVTGTEVYISFLDRQCHPTPPPPEVIAGRALCTNRRLPELMVTGPAQLLSLEGPGPVSRLELVSRPTPHDTPALMGDRPWAMVSQLSLNHLSLANGPQALAALKTMLRCHVGPSQVVGIRQIDGIRRVQCWPVMHPLERGGIRGMVQGLHVRLTLDRTQFESGGTVLFASVLRYFLAMYTSINTPIAVSVQTTDSTEVITQWAPLLGSQILL